MLARIAKLFRRETPSEAYARGRRCADTILAEAVQAGHSREQGAAFLHATSDGGFNATPRDRAFDRGITDRLKELGLENPYH